MVQTHLVTPLQGLEVMESLGVMVVLVPVVLVALEHLLTLSIVVVMPLNILKLQITTFQLYLIPRALVQVVLEELRLLLAVAAVVALEAVAGPTSVVVTYEALEAVAVVALVLEVLVVRVVTQVLQALTPLEELEELPEVMVVV